MSKSVTINDEQRLFVLPCGEGYSTLGFENCYKQLKALQEAMALSLPDVSEIGTLGQYEQYRAALQAFARHPTSKETWFHPDTSPLVRAILERARLHHTKIRLHYGDPETGVSWLDENDVIGYIGRSTGTLKVPLLIAENEDGGPAVLDHCIVCIQRAGQGGGEMLYQHLHFRVPDLCVVPCTQPEGYTYAVQQAKGEGPAPVDWLLGDDQFPEFSVVAHFKSEAKAHRYVAFMQGQRMTL